LGLDGTKLRNAKRWAAGRGGYLAACLALGFATFVRMVIHPAFESRSPFVTYVVAAFLVTFYFGFGPALLVVSGGLLIGIYYFVPPFGVIVTPEPGDVVIFAGYLIVVLLGIYIIEVLQRSRYELRLLREVAQARLEMLERSQSERALAVEAARRSDIRYHELAAQAREVLYMRRLDGHFEYFNDEFYVLTGLEQGSLDGDIWQRAVHPDDLAGLQNLWRDVAVSGERQASGFRVRGADGSYRWLTGTAQCLEDKRGKIIKWSGVPAEDAAGAPATAASSR
jgi:PAS domain S-box-containing protein